MAAKSDAHACHELSPLFVISLLLVNENGKSITTMIPRDILEYAEASDDYDYDCICLILQ